MPETTLRAVAEPAPAPLRVPPSSARLAGWIVLALIAALLCAYAGIVRADFINFDDNSHVFENPLVRGGLSWHGIREAFAHPQASLWIPLTWISFMVDVSLFGLNPGEMHAVNVAWHIASTVLLFLTLRRMTGHLWASAFVAALFGLHPLNVESVAWVAERKNMLCGFFWIAAVAAYVRYAEKPRLLPWLFALTAAALALLAKPMAVTLPCTLLLLDFWPLQRWRAVRWTRLLLEKIPFFLLCLGSSWMAMHARRADAVVTTETLPALSRLSNALVSYVIYLEKLFLPVRLGVFYPHPIHAQPVLAGLAAALLAAITVVAVCSRKTRPYLLMGWLWFLGVLVPVSGLVQVGSQARADRFCYLPELGIFVAATWFLAERWKKHRRVLGWSAAAALFACALLTSHQLSYWQDGTTLFEHTIAVTSNNACAYANAGLHRARAGDTAQAIPHFQASLRIQPDQPSIWREFGAALEKIGKPADALRAFRTALFYDPADLQARYALGAALVRSGAPAEALSNLEQVLRELPHSARTHYALARALEALGRRGDALIHLRAAAELAPDRPLLAAALRQVELAPPRHAELPEF